MDSSSTFSSPYYSDYPIDCVPGQNISPTDHDKLCLQYLLFIGSLNWLAHTTQPDLSTVMSLLAQHQRYPSSSHFDAAPYVVHYLPSTKHLGIDFTSGTRYTMETFLHFPTIKTLLSMSDANWGPQDATKLNSIMELLSKSKLTTSFVYLCSASSAALKRCPISHAVPVFCSV